MLVYQRVTIIDHHSVISIGEPAHESLIIRHRWSPLLTIINHY